MTTTDLGYDAEQYVLSAMMRDTRAVLDVFAAITPADFHEPKHEAIGEAILALANRNAPTDPVCVAEELRVQGRGHGIELADLFRIEQHASTWSNAGYYADLVKGDAVRRRLREAGGQLVDMATGEGDPIALAERARAIVDLVSTASADEVRPIGATLNDVIDSLDEEPHFYPTPWREINSYIHGFKPGAVCVIAARPGAGKSIMALQSATALSTHGNVAHISLEMGQDELTKRLISSHASISMGLLSRHTLAEADWHAVAAARADIEKLRIFVDDRSGLSLTQIRQFARSVSRKGPLSGIIVDYLGLVKTDKAGRTPRWEAVGELTRDIKAMAREMRVPVILLVQLNRESEGQQRRLPSLIDLRESGSIEQDADVVLLLQRRKDKDGNYTDDLDVVVAKNRQGQTGRTSLAWEAKFSRVVSPPWNPLVGTADWRAMQAGN